MVGAGFSVDDFTGAGFFKSLGCSAIGFDFWHDYFLSFQLFNAVSGFYLKLSQK
jgi:hypothetical protein